MREDPDVILVGELRDAETISMAMTAAETGHLVFGTLHTTGRRQNPSIASSTPLPVRRIREADQELPRQNTLLAVITQILVEVRRCARAARIVRDHGDDEGHCQLIQTDQTASDPHASCRPGRDFGHADARPGAARRHHGEEIDPDDAYAYATEKRLFQKYVTDNEPFCRSFDVAGSGTRIGPGPTAACNLEGRSRGNH